MRRQAAAPPELPGYKYIDHLGSGGFADVYRYEQRLPRRQVAVKVLLADDLTGDTRAQFVGEANLMAQLSAHPYIVTIFHADVSADGRPYFVMEYCPGPSLATRLKREPLGVAEALRTGIRIAGAVATAHSAGILHRDIKPANVLTNSYGWPALTDFGISSNLEGEVPELTMTVMPGQAPGATTGGSTAVGMSVPWSPPELFEDDPRADPRSDVYSLAATVHTLLAGRSPFEIPGRSNGALDLIGRIERGAITPIGRPDVPTSFVEVLRKGMAPKPADRYQSAVEFARALQRVELELGYAATGIEVPNLAEPQPDDRGEPDEPDAADATRARTVQSVAAQPPAAPTGGLADVTRARAPISISPQPAPSPVDDRTVVSRPSAPAATAPAPSPGVAVSTEVDESTVLRPRQDELTAGAPAAAGPKRSRAGLVVGLVAGGIVAIVVAVSVVFASVSPPTPQPETTTAAKPEDAVVEASVPSAVVAPGAISADGTSATFAVSHEGAEDGDRYRWTRADGIGGTQSSDGPQIVVEGLTPGQAVCIDVAVQRGGRTSEAQRGCTQ
ncbi:serine/threonine protein kinase [Agromyces protaetiae]|uniref:non-specific serine/threonine protein kinase n=1 Tax=Agromyces protaetiae TaxID=2509455 RepID=A0A4P6FCI0_9MICO|nr:serine/threonine-protein kinase [Agromyces protaetiae]QAY73762.1 serine/threonine protein kinase [Agromyces protaetiae]